MSHIESFNVAQGANPRILILGSIPGIASLQAGQYYAHPRNAFWPIICHYFHMDVNLPYEPRLADLKRNGVALWDVLHRAKRQGSLDSAIEKQSMEPNPIDFWLEENSTVSKILLNGGTAAKEFRRNFKPLLQQSSLQVITCPSTSPAYAAMPVDEKRRRWHAALMA